MVVLINVQFVTVHYTNDNCVDARYFNTLAEPSGEDLWPKKIHFLRIKAAKESVKR